MKKMLTGLALAVAAFTANAQKLTNVGAAIIPASRLEQRPVVRMAMVTQQGDTLVADVNPLGLSQMVLGSRSREDGKKQGEFHLETPNYYGVSDLFAHQADHDFTEMARVNVDLVPYNRKQHGAVTWHLKNQ